MIKSRRIWSGLGLGVVTVALAIDIAHRPERMGIDFHTYLAAATVGLQQGWSHIYDQALVAAAQKQLDPHDWSQPFLSPPTVAWLVAPLTLFSYWVAYSVWAVFTFIVLAGALVWSGVSTGISRWIVVVAALAPWWVIHAVNLGQVVPLVAAGVVVGWRLLRDDRDVAAGIALSVIFLKPNTAILVPFALLVAGRYRAFVSWLAVGGALALIAVLLLGVHGTSAYVNELRAPLPSGADALTLHGAMELSGVVALAVRLLIVGAVLATAFKLRGSSGMVFPLAIVGSLLTSPYLHASDLCLLAAAAWIVWEERPDTAWRVALPAAWVLASPFLWLTTHSPGLNRWPWIELIFLAALGLMAWRPLTGPADLRTRAPA
ncbi:MAG TPA: glycosyltransferase family 87 protein [Verrucomicrobiae bacterium]|nr:glycosyltransferase family 87 protein [Verrucomicrobiae bacterium]